MNAVAGVLVSSGSSAFLASSAICFGNGDMVGDITFLQLSGSKRTVKTADS